MNYQEIFRWLAIAIGIGGMIVWMITYQLCVMYFRKNKKDIAYILYLDRMTPAVKSVEPNLGDFNYAA